MDKCDTSTADFVECGDCGHRFVGADLQSQLLRWKHHSDTDCPANKEQHLTRG